MNIDWHTFENFGAAVLLVLGGLILGPLCRALILRISRKVWDKGAMTFIGSFANVAIITISVILAMDKVGINTSIFVGAFSALGLGISLALKDNMANVAGGLQILITRPFKVGDFVKIGRHQGYVRAIELMYTTLDTFGNKEVIIPNSKMISRIVVNCSNNPVRRITFTIPIYKYADISYAIKQIQSLAKEDTRVLKDPAPSIQVEKIGREYVDVILYVYVNIDHYWDVNYDLNTKIACSLKSFASIEKTDKQ